METSEQDNRDLRAFRAAGELLYRLHVQREQGLEGRWGMAKAEGVAAVEFYWEGRMGGDRYNYRHTFLYENLCEGCLDLEAKGLVRQVRLKLNETLRMRRAAQDGDPVDG